MDAVRRAREASQKNSVASAKANGKGKTKVNAAEESTDGDGPKKSYSAEMLKKMGFNPLAGTYAGRQAQKNPERSALAKVCPRMLNVYRKAEKSFSAC